MAIGDDDTEIIPTGLIWHYTGYRACENIIQNGTMWATHWQYLNDLQEYKYAVKVARQVIQDGGFPDIGAPVEADRVASTLNMLLSALDDIYVTCFSREPDDLSQWRGYARDIPGFAIGFDPTLLADSLSSTPNRSVVTVEYEDKPLLAAMRTLLMRPFDWLMADPTFPTMTKDGRLTLFYATYFNRLGLHPDMTNFAIAAKHPAFKYEREVRMVARPGPGDTRQSASASAKTTANVG